MKDVNELEKFFFREKPARIMIALKENQESSYITFLAKKTNCTFSHVFKILKFLKKFNLVTFKKKGRIRIVKLTDDGWDVAHNIEAILKKFRDIQKSVGKK